MIVCSMHEIGKMYGSDWIFKDINIRIQDAERVGIVGENGSGKTTLLKLISGVDEPDSGQIFIKKNIKVGYLKQIPDYCSSTEVMQVLIQPFSNLLEIKKEIDLLATKMTQLNSDDQRLDEIMTQYTSLVEEFDQKHGYLIETKIAKVLKGLSIDERITKGSFGILSGGEKTKIELATVLLHEPDLLLLDEPTNHLDLTAIEWLENYLSQYKGTIMVISHDRYFLDRIAKKIYHIEDGKITPFYGNYSYFTSAKENKLGSEYHNYKEQQKKIQKIETSIKRLREFGLYSRANSKEKALERMELIEKPILERPKIDIDFNVENRSSQDVVVLNNVSRSFCDRVLFEEVDIIIRYKEKVAIVGNNGTGKTTLIKIIQGELQPDLGTVYIGPGVKKGYISQNEFDNFNNETLINVFRDEVKVDEDEAEKLLSGFLFFGDVLHRKIRNLSGGERMRLRLAQLMYQDLNLLILDEPTNHLDIASREVLEKALEDFDGTIIAVSHDRFFLNKMFHRIYWIENNKILGYEGNLEEVKRKRRVEY
ncbi:ABC-F family ATP-binding cassette domain-containing protein [Paenibacillus sp. GCM10027626]|uniref:ABC-F family ATP-binding cassette domain-containing protein n=1 Tax=Paenibacillus sp. GCM10027626 TaxID=3273411 RepID=UPI00363500B7